MSVLQTVQKIQESFSDGLCDLVTNINMFREQNAQPHANLPAGVNAFVSTTTKLCEIARKIGKAYFSGYPTILAEINRASDKAEQATVHLVNALQSLFKNSDKKKGWEDLMESTKTISNCTIDLLAVITGADLKRLTIALSQLKDDISKFESFDVTKNPQGFNDAGQDAANKTNLVSGYLKQRANDTESPLVKAKLLEDSERYANNAKAMIDIINKSTNNPNDKNIKDQRDKMLKDMKEDAGNVSAFANENTTGVVKNEEGSVVSIPMPTRRPGQSKQIGIANQQAHDVPLDSSSLQVTNQNNEMEKEIREKEKKVKDALGDLANASNSKNPQQYNAALGSFKQAHQDYINCPLPKNILDDPHKYRAVKESRDDLDALLPKVIDTSKNNFDSPNNYYKNYHLNAARQFDRGLNRATAKVAPKAGQDEMAIRDAAKDLRQVIQNRKLNNPSPNDAQVENDARFRITISANRRAPYSSVVCGPSDELKALWMKKKIGTPNNDDDELKRVDALVSASKANEIAAIQEMENTYADIAVSSDCGSAPQVNSYAHQLQNDNMNQIHNALANSPAQHLMATIQADAQNVAQKTQQYLADKTDNKLADVHTAIVKSKLTLAQAKLALDPNSTDRAAHVELQKSLVALHNVREAIANAEDDQTPINRAIENAHNQINHSASLVNQLAQRETNSDKRDAIASVNQRLLEINKDFRPNTNTSTTSRPSLTIMEDAVEKVIDGLNSDGNKSIATLKYDNRPQAHAIIKESASSSVEDKIDIVAATIAAEAKEFENKIASQVSDHLAQIAKYARIGDKRNMIEESKLSSLKINELVAILRDYAQRIGKTPSERQLQDRLIQTAQSLQNNATHLKILVSVKAASSETNKDTDESLTALISGIGAHISEGLSVMRTTENTVLNKKSSAK